MFLVSARDAVEHLAMCRTVPWQRMVCFQMSIVPWLRRPKNIHSANWEVWSVSPWGPPNFGPCSPFRLCSYLAPSALAWSLVLAVPSHPTAWNALTPWRDLGSFSERSWGYIHPKVTVLLHYINTPLRLPCSVVFITTKHCIAYLFLCLCIIRLSHRNSTGATVLFWGLLYSQYLKQSLQGLWTASEKHISLCFCV